LLARGAQLCSLIGPEETQREFEINTQNWRLWIRIRNFENRKNLLQRSRKAPIKLAWIDRLCGFG